MRSFALYAVFCTYFMSVGCTSAYSTLFFQEIGMNNSQIGALMSVPAMIAMCLNPAWGLLGDRARLKRNVLTLALVINACACFCFDLTDQFLPLMVIMTVSVTAMQPTVPMANSIALEYTHERGMQFGPIRMAGSIGYQVAALAIGLVLTSSLRGLYRIVGALLLAAGLLAQLMPPVAGHQHSGKLVSPLNMFKNKRVLLLLGMILVGCTTTNFYYVFYSKHFVSLGASNAMVGVMQVITVVLEIPFLFFADRLMKRMSIWGWLLMGMLVSGLRFVGFALSGSLVVQLLFQVPAVITMACFEYYPAIYINSQVPAQLKSSAQTTLILVSGGLTRVLGAMVGGVLSDALGIGPVFLLNGAMLLVGAAAFFPACRRMAREDQAAASA